MHANLRKARLLAGGGLLFVLTPLAMTAAEVRPARLSAEPVPPYTLPDPLVAADGSAVEDADAWANQRRPELLGLFAEQVYGRTPPMPDLTLTFAVTSTDPDALQGRATRKEITLWFDAAQRSPPLRVLLYVPNDAGPGPHPAFLGVNFYGNHTVHADPGITLSTAWVPGHAAGVASNRATEASRGSDASKWAIETVLARGYATATFYCGDLCPDRPDGLNEGLQAWLGLSGTKDRAPDAWGAIGVWAWGLSRVLDYLEQDPDVDAKRVAVHGHSRLGKTALWAGAQDARFAMVISNESGCGGAALSKRLHGETVERINAVFPHWFARNFRRYDNNEAELPVDQHQLLALIAPRPLLVASAEGDDWADPEGEFLAVRAAAPVYALLGFAADLPDQVPPVHQPVGDRLRYHIRAGEHNLTAFDWACFLDAADLSLRPKTTR